MARRVIALLGYPILNEEDKAAEAITPGHLLAYDSNGDLIKHNDDASNAAPMFALERDEMGKDIDTAYAVGDQVKVGTFSPGQRVYAIIASGANVAKGDYLTSDGAGRLTKTGVSATVRLAEALEDVNNSAGPSDARIRVQIV